MSFGLVKHNNNSISAITTAGQLATGSMVLIKEQTASSSATISFVDGSSDTILDSTYPIYLFKFINIHPATDNVSFQFNLSIDSGSNYNVTKTTSWFNTFHDEADSNTNLRYDDPNTFDLAQSTSFATYEAGLGNDNDQSCVGNLFLFNPSNTTFVKHFFGTSNSALFHNYTRQAYVAGYGNTTSAVDAVQFKMSSGNIDSGTIKLYGIKDS